MPGDMQKEHTLTYEAIIVTVRPMSILFKNVYAYETFSETEWNIPHKSSCFIPNMFVDITIMV